MQRNNRNIPKNSVDIHSLVHSSQAAQNASKKITPGVHKTESVTLKHNQEEVYFYKENAAKYHTDKIDHKKSEYESTAGALYTFLIGDHAALTMGVVNDKGERLGAISKAIPGFLTFKAASEQQQQSILRKANLPKNRLIQNHIAAVLVASYVFDENDLHLENIGFNQQGKVVKIDHDNSFFTLTRKYSRYKDEKTYQIQIDAKDIESFPVLKIANPRRWVIDEFKTSALKTANQDAAFNEEKYTYFLKAAILPEALIIKISEDNFSTKQGATRFINYLSKRLEKLSAELLKVTEFAEFMQGNPGIGTALIETFPAEIQQQATMKLEAIIEALQSKQNKTPGD